MPTETIPYDPSLVLGMVIQTDKIQKLIDIAEAQNPINLSRDKVNAYLRQKLSLDMMMQELITLKVDPKQVEKVADEIDKLNAAVGDAAIELATNVMTAESKIAELKLEQGQKQISSAVQSPVDFAASALKSMPISSDTMSMDVQYFRNQTNKDSNSQHSNKVASFVAGSVGDFFGDSFSAKMGAQSNSAVTRASSNHELLGTLVFVVNCTHKNAQMFSPLVLDVETAIDSWIATKGNWPGGDPEDPKVMATIAKTKTEQKDYENGLPILAGATYGSSFVGFVHFSQVETNEDSQEADSVAVQASAKIERDLFLGKAMGEIGLSAEAANSVRDLLSTSNIQSHASVISMGIMPSIKSNAVTSTVSALKDSPDERMKALAAMQGASNTGLQTMASAAGNARKEATIEKMSTDYVSAAIQGAATVDTESNQVINLNSLMIALDDFIKRANGAEGGVPINFYIKYVSARSIAISWLQQFAPEKLDEIRGVKKDSDKEDTTN
jgi:hypothetical protein|uniref:hypothetical protein n=1 Tax=Gelidibacter sp. TaxID=2018083 RepID=UPI00404B2052